MKKLHWKKKTFSDLSGSWVEAHVPVLDWTYSVEESYESNGTYEAYVLLGPGVDSPKKLHSGTKSLEKAKALCTQHLTKSLEKLQAYLPTQG
jgi:hypothetical protein